jgi:GrpB-like predicted nucleotidyltransferase (UPF0157 family)
MRRITISKYDNTWPDAFCELSSALRRHLGPLAARLEHVGSTSVPGLAAKPIIDLDVVIESTRLLSRVSKCLREIGYIHEGDLGVPGREAFERLGRDVPRVGVGRTWSEHHLYVCAQDSPELRRHVQFRDYLRHDPDELAVYACLKRQLAAECGENRHAYTAGKARFIENILARVGEGLEPSKRTT